ncbi:MAG: HEAT repeat domain-containing protein [Byssovorax sp.]
MLRTRLSFGPALAVPLVLAAPPAFADGALSLVSPAGHGQQALAIQAENGAIRARVCAADPCSADGGALLPLPEEARSLLGHGRAASIELEGGKRLVEVVLPQDPAGPPEGGAWVMLLAAPLAGKGSEPLVVWSGMTGVPRGEVGEQRSAAIVIEPTGDAKSGARRVLVGERRDDLGLCGRPTLVSVKVVDPATFELGRGATVQNLSAAERDKAIALPVDRLGSDARPGSPVRLLRATAASSAVDKKLAALTDGDMSTAWSENKSGIGEGEFVTMASPAEVGITAIDLVLRPTADIEGGAAPRHLYLATPDRLFALTLPEDAWKQPPGTRYGVKLPEPLRASCVALVLGDAFAKPGKSDPNDPAAAKLPRVTVAEIEAHSAFDGATVEGLAAALVTAGERGDDRARAAAALLSRGGAPAIQALMAAFAKLDERGKELAIAVADGAPCVDQVPFFAARLADATPPPAAPPVEADAAKLGPKPAAPRARPEDPVRAHARDRLRRCGRASAPALAALVKEGTPETRVAAADELALVAPAEAVPALLDALGVADDALRRDLRAALARAARSPHAQSALRDEVEPARFSSRSETVAIDLLRAAGPVLAKIEGGPQAFAKLAVPSASFRARYLLQAPAAELALGGDAAAEAFLRESLRADPSAEVRARAAEVAGKVPALVPALLAAVADPAVRVRKAAIEGLAASLEGGSAAPAGLAGALVRVLGADDWTFLRASSARALGALPAAAPLDAALAKALADLSPDVRGQALDALAAHRATAHIEAIRERAALADELPEVRARAILALGALCDRSALDDLTRRAARAVAPLDEVDRRLGGASVAALGAIHPPDLQARLAPLLAKDAPPMLREMARAALSAESSCPR